jgi:hypothetical protein
VPPSVFRGWADQDRDEAVALILEEWDTCSGCGQVLSEATDPDAEGRYTVDEVMCAGCQARQTIAEREHYRGRMLRVRRR